MVPDSQLHKIYLDRFIQQNQVNEILATLDRGYVEREYPDSLTEREYDQCKWRG